MSSAGLTDFLNFRASLPNNAPDYALMKQNSDLLVFVILLVLKHEGYGGLHHLAAGVQLLGRDAHDPLGPGRVGNPDVGIVIGPQLLNVASLLANYGSSHFAGDQKSTFEITCIHVVAFIALLLYTIKKLSFLFISGKPASLNYLK